MERYGTDIIALKANLAVQGRDRGMESQPTPHLEATSQGLIQLTSLRE